MNELQEAIFEVIFLSFPSKLENLQNSAIRYGILNYVAKFSLANNEYFISEKCFEHISELNLINNKGLRRGKKGTNINSPLSTPSHPTLSVTFFRKL